jgi:hypothetical protein
MAACGASVYVLLVRHNVQPRERIDPHGVPTTHGDQIDVDLLVFIEA